VHRGIGRDNPVRCRWQQLDAVRPNQLASSGPVLGAARAEHVPAIVNLEQAAAFRFRPMPSTILEGRQYVTVRQPEVSVGMHVSVEVAEGRNDVGLQWVSQIEHPSPAGLETVSHEQAADGHLHQV